MRSRQVAGRAANKRFPEEDLDTALKKCNNDPSAAATLLVNMGRAENNTVDKRQGHSTRAQVRDALQTCDFDEDSALWMLKNADKLLKQKHDYISERLGVAHGLGFPSQRLVSNLLVKHRCEEGKVMAELKRSWKLDLEMIVEIVAAA